ncbi:MAG: flagellar biosynthesis protein [Rhodanobacter sp. SCN 68-63]|nr:MAG: flagellar biosynthesis protein [Rhodanobacter sp. SCN 68-63]
MTQALPNPQRRVTLKLTSGSGDTAAPSPRVPAETLDLLLARARNQGIPLHPDAQIASAALRLRDDVPGTLYAAAASVLACVYEASGEKL